MSCHEEEQKQQRADAHHHAEGIEAQRNVRHNLCLVLDVAIAKVLHVGIDERLVDGNLNLLLRMFRFQTTIFGKRFYGHLAALYTFVERRHKCAVGLFVAFDDVVNARHIAVGAVCGEQRQSRRNGYAQRCLAALGIVGLLEGVYGRYCCEAHVLSSVVESLHGSELHGLLVGHLHSRHVACAHGEQRSHDAHDACNLYALRCQPLVAFLQQVPAAHSHHERRSHNPR